MVATRKPRFTLKIEGPANGKIGKVTVLALDKDGNTADSDRANLTSASERQKLVKRMAEKLKADEKNLLGQLEGEWNRLLDEHRRLRERAAAGSPEAAPVEKITLLDTSPRTIRRPLSLIDGRAYAAAWVSFQRSISQSVKGDVIVKHDPPRVTVEEVCLIVSGDGTCYAEKPVEDFRPLDELRMPIKLPHTLPPGRGWSGAGVKRFLAGDRPDPAEVFRRVVQVVNRFIDFSRSLTKQETMCELIACYVLSTYLLDAFHVVGYLWPNGERGTGKSICLQLIAELSYLGHFILASSSYACLRDMADYGATLCFDDAESVMDIRRTDPDKRTLLLAGNRRGATVTVKVMEGDNWVMHHVNTFCPRLFSAIRLPDEVLGSRSIVVPLVRSGDPDRTKADCMNPEDWPCDRGRLTDDLWALGLANLPELPRHDREAAENAELSGRNLDPWRPILAVAHWLQQRHGVEGLFGRMEELSTSYQSERGEVEAEDRVRVLFRALLQLSQTEAADAVVKIRPSEVAEKMNAIARLENLTDEEKSFTTSRRVGWLLKRQRFRKAESDERGKQWEMTRGEIEAAAKAYGVEECQHDEAPF
jgi:hypothetical protein